MELGASNTNLNLSKEQVENSLSKFITWLDGYGEYSYDRMDYWSSGPGVFAKKVYYKSKLLGSPLAIWGLILENYLPQVQKLYGVPRREAIGDAHYAMGYMNLYEITGKTEYLSRAKKYLDELKKSRCKNYENFCWGYTYGWETKNGFLPPSTPFITVTPYPFWAFKKYYEITGDTECLSICKSAADFALEDLKKIEIDGHFSTSYSPVDLSPVINANSYRAALLCDSYALFKNEKYYKEALENIQFVLYNQKSDGRWYYEAINENNSFIDNFHTCFVLRNMARCNFILKDIIISDSIKKGYNYYINNLLNSKSLPKHFAISNNYKLRKYEMYDFAEGITLGCLLKDEIPGAFSLSQSFAKKLIDQYQLRKGYFLTRVSEPGIKHKIPYHRWPQAQLFYSLTNLLKELK